jgi:hypothetical protein
MSGVRTVLMMKNLELDGTKVILSGLTQSTARAAPCELLLPITPKTKNDALAHFQSVGTHGKYSGLHVSGKVDLSFLADFPNLLYLEIVDQPKVNTAPLQALRNLRGLHLETPGSGLDFSWFPELEIFKGDWHPDNQRLSACRQLHRLHLWNFKPRSKDLQELAGIVRLEQLSLIKTTVESLQGIETLTDLRQCEISYAAQLQSLSALETEELQLRDFSISKAKAIVEYRPIAACRWLRNLWLSSCAPLSDLSWLLPLQRLEFISIVETDLASGDLTPLLKLPELRYVGSMDKKHYKPRIDDFNEQLNARFAT